ncbi:MAG: hypothetical protein M1834_001171 [Cirrosporium novae-zelandiae]|nr:MAG: hypothetical protein M1834_001171 [Cirrosporium novae-zelandiae]
MVHTRQSGTQNGPEPSVLASNDMDYNDTASDTSIGEQPVREKLKKTSITSLPKYGMISSTSPDDMVPEETVPEEITNGGVQKMDEEPKDEQDGSKKSVEITRGRPARKRSFDDLDTADGQLEEGKSTNTTKEHRSDGHTRKRSRDIQNEDTKKPNNVSKPVAKEPVKEVEEDDSNGLARSQPPKDINAIIKIGPPKLKSTTQTSAERASSPKKKRSRDQVESDDGTPAELKSDSSGPSSGSEDGSYQDGQETGDEPKKKKHRESSEGRRKASTDAPTKKTVPALSGFANASAQSPFGSLAATKPESSIFGSRSKSPSKSPAKSPAETSSSAFATSGFASISGSASPFNALGAAKSTPLTSFASKPSGSATPPLTSFASKPTASPAPAKLSFSTSAFAATSSSTGTTSFATAAGFSGLKSGVITSFASKPSSTSATLFKSKSPKPFGAPEEDENTEEEKDSNDKEEQEGGASFAAAPDKPDERFHEQEVNTGEEDEETLFSCRAKLYHFEKGEWKERGVGTLKLNSTEKHGKTTSRLIMRTDGVYKVVLNTPIFKGMIEGEDKNPTKKAVVFKGIEEGKPVPVIVRTGSMDNAKRLSAKIQEMEEML